jgi:dienelactone hydrolase
MSRFVAVLGAVGAMLAAAPSFSATQLESYGKLPFIEPSQFVLSPAGDRIAFIAAAGAGRQLVVKDLTSNKVLVATPLTKPKIQYLDWAGEDHVLVGARMTSNDLYSVTPNIEEVGSNVVIPLNGAKPFVVFHGQDKIWPDVYGYEGTYQIGGKWYGFFEGVAMKVQGSSMDQLHPNGTPDLNYLNLYRVDLDTGATSMIAGRVEKVSARVVSPNGEVVAHSNYVEETGAWSLYAGLNGRELFSTKAPLHDVGLDGLGRRPNTVMVSDSRADSASIKEYDVSSLGDPVELFKDEAVDGLIHDHNGYLVGAVIAHEQGEETVFLDPAIKAAFDRATKPFKGMHVAYVSADAGWNKWLILTDGDGDSGTYYMVDLAKGAAEEVATLYPDIDSADIGPVKMISYKAGDGMALHAVLTLPVHKPAKNLPVIVLPHGGPEAHDVPGFDWLAQAFASRGYAVVQPNFRGSTGGATELRDAGYGEWGRKMQTDVSDALAELVRQGIADPKRACIVGASYGGYVALAGVTVQNGLYRCAVSYAGPSELNDMLKWERDRYGENTSVGRFWRKFMGAKSDTDGALREISPADLAARADGPILLIHGKLDSQVPIEQSRTMEQALKRAGKSVQFVELDGEDHHLSKEATRVQMIKAAVEFVEAHNPPG